MGIDYFTRVKRSTYHLKYVENKTGYLFKLFFLNLITDTKQISIPPTYVSFLNFKYRTHGVIVAPYSAEKSLH